MRIRISGKEYPVRLTMGAMLRFKRETGKEVSEIGDSLSLLTVLVWCCLQSACAADGVECTLTLDEMADRLEPSEVTRFASEISQTDDGSKKKSPTEQNPPPQASSN